METEKQKTDETKRRNKSDKARPEGMEEKKRRGKKTEYRKDKKGDRMKRNEVSSIRSH
jgi:hypothetical protein